VLKERVLTALVLAAVLLGVMLGLSWFATVWLLTVLVLVGAWEWAGFIGKSSPGSRAAYTVAIAIALVASLYLRGSVPNFVVILMTVAVAWWFVAFLWLCLAPGMVTPVTATLAGFLSLVPCWLALVHLTIANENAHWVLFTFALVWAGDTGAFFVGRWLGRVPLAPRVSPKKTWEGALGGVLASGAVAWASAKWLFELDAWPFVMTCVAVAALSIVGDLTESMLKRAAGLKDSGTMFPGHGGMLDRIDSVTAAAPALVFALIGLEVIT
jgi:phosphatidate cytidylyltransferase